jgi:hypothetical protein
MSASLAMFDVHDALREMLDGLLRLVLETPLQHHLSVVRQVVVDRLDGDLLVMEHYME